MQRIRGAAVFFPAEEIRDRGGDELLRLADCGGKIEPAREAGGDGGAVRAAGSVGVHAGDERGLVRVHAAVGQDEEVGGDGFAQVSAFDEEGGAVARCEFEAGVAHFGDAGDGAAGESADFVEVWRDEGGEGKEQLAVARDSVGEEEGIAAGGDHHGVHDDRNFGLIRASALTLRAARGSLARSARLWVLDFEFIQRFHDGADDFGRVEHPGLDCGDGECAEEQADLLCDNRARDGMHGADFSRHLGDDAGDGGDAVSAKRADGFQIGLRACACAVVGAGNGEDDGEHGGGRTSNIQRPTSNIQ